MLGIDREYPVGYPKDMLTFVLKNRKKAALKPFLENPIL